jgi:DNA modification methylase
MSARQRRRPVEPSPELLQRVAGSLDLHIVQLPLGELHPANRNARTHSKKQVEQIAASIAKFGFNNPVLVDDDNRLIAGHGRVAAAKLLGMDEVPTIRLSHLSEAERRAYALAENRLAELAGWDEELLTVELLELQDLDLDFDVEITGFDLIDIDRMDERVNGAKAAPEDDCVPEPEARAVSQAGDLWRLGEHRLICGDARDAAVYERLMDGRPAQMVFSDPPCNVKVDHNVCGLGRIRHREFVMASGEMSKDTFTAFLRDAFRQMAAVSQDGAVHFICMDWRHIGELLAAGNEVYGALRNLCVWAKDNAGMGSFYRSQHELVFVFKHGEGKAINTFGLGGDGRHRSNVWSYPGINSMKSDRMDELAMHPTVKPVAMVMDAIKDCSLKGGIILDAFGGSGTTLIAAHRTKRIARLIELDPLYVDVIIRRWEALTGLKAIHTETGQTFAEAAEH